MRLTGIRLFIHTDFLHLKSWFKYPHLFKICPESVPVVASNPTFD